MRPRMTWLVIGGVAALLVVAVVDALRSSEGEDARSGTTTSSTNEVSPTETASTTDEASVSAWQKIEEAGNEWARLFAGDRHFPAPGTCQYMTQPGCERINCERVGGRPIENCTRPSREFRQSFADASVTAIAINGRRAVAKFSNGETVRMEIVESGDWWIHSFGGGNPGATQNDGAAQAAIEIEITADGFNLAWAEVTVGQEINFNNNDSKPHTITGTEGTEQVVKAGETFNFKIDGCCGATFTDKETGGEFEVTVGDS